MCWRDSTPGWVCIPSLRAGTASSTPSVTPHWSYSGPRAPGVRPQIHVLCGLKGSGCSPPEFFMGGFWNMPGQDKHSHCGLFNVAFCQPSRGRCVGFTPLSAFFLSNVYQELWKRMGVPGRGEKNEVLKGRFLWCRGARGDWIPSSSQMRMLPWFPGDMWRLSLVSCCPPVIITKLWHFLFWFGQFWGWFVSPGSTCRP